jgi:ribonuclease Z
MEKCYWKKINAIKLKNTPYTLQGYSVAARNTGFYIPELRIALDCGVPSNHSPEHIFITHCHLDHCGCLPNTIIDTGSVQPRIYVPKYCEEQLRNYIHHTFVMTKNNQNPNIHNKCRIIGGLIGERINTLIKKMPYVIDVFKSFHTVPCVSYGFSEIRTKLKPEFTNCKQSEIEEAKLNGIEVTNQIEVPQFCFVGDTDERILTNSNLEKYPTIIIECTFLYPEHEIHAKKDKHMHWNKLEAYIRSHTNNNFVLIHFSSRYTDEEITTFFSDKSLENLTVWN